MNLSPIILFVYNRRYHLEKTIESLRKNSLAKKSCLFIFSDGPKDVKDESNINKVRQFIRKVDGFKKIYIRESANHKGLASSIINGVTEIISRYEKVIVLEDDIQTSPNFLLFMNTALEKYQKNKKIFSIGGYTYPITIPGSYKLPVFLYYRCCSWGWATWADRWRKADWEVKNYNEFKQDPQKRIEFNRGGEDLSDMLDFQMRGKIDSWAIRWCYAHYQNHAYCLYPVVSKVRNIGLDGSGTHRSFRLQNIRLDTSATNFRLPPDITVSPEIVSLLNNYFQGDIIRKTVHLIKKIIN